MDEVKTFSTLLGQKTRFVGNISGTDNCIVYGKVEGDCNLQSVLVLGDHSHWQGNITAPSVIVAGQVKGDISANQLELTASAQVQGAINCPVVAIENGAIHQGDIRMEKDTAVVHFSERREYRQAPEPDQPQK